jgi:hypothetical protein
MDSEAETEFIDTAIVIKNIPFEYPEEAFTAKLFPKLELVPPYAFNYHRNNPERLFHGLAFANFNSAEEAKAAVDKLDNYELGTRRLRVELKRRLSAEAEQRQKLARQSRRRSTHQNPRPTGFIQPGMAKDDGPSPIEPMTFRHLDPQLRPRVVYPSPINSPKPQAGISILFCADQELDMNDLDTLRFYTTMQIFFNEPNTAESTLQFPSRLTIQQRKIVRSLAIKLKLYTASHSVGNNHFITVARRPIPQCPTDSCPTRSTITSTEHATPPFPQYDLHGSKSMTNLRTKEENIDSVDSP